MKICGGGASAKVVVVLGFAVGPRVRFVVVAAVVVESELSFDGIASCCDPLLFSVGFIFCFCG